MIKLKQTGFFKELEYGGGKESSIYDMQGKVDKNLKENIISYLERGNVLGVAAGFSMDIMSTDEEIIVGSIKMLTDGVWVWPGDLAYYVDKYDVGLENEFLQFMEEKKWQVDEISRECLDKKYYF